MAHAYRKALNKSKTSPKRRKRAVASRNLKRVLLQGAMVLLHAAAAKTVA